VPFVDVIQSDLDIVGAVVQWNVSAHTTGDYLRIVRPGGGYALRITKDGQIFIGEQSLEAYIARQVQLQTGIR
jgi:hypothetical protein